MKRRVALLIETSSNYGRQVLSGVARYMRLHDDWSVFLEQRDLNSCLPPWLHSWQGDGIISRTTTRELAETVKASKIPLVELTDRYQDLGLVLVRSDDEAIARLAAQHLLERGFRHFGFCGFRHEAWSERRQIAFVDEIKKANCDCHLYESDWQGPDALAWEDEQQLLASWLRRLPRPIGIMACNDLRGKHVLDACSMEQVAVPEVAAVIGVDDDDLLCRVCDPPLSSVVPNAEGVGYRAAELLWQMMNHQELESHQFMFPPLGVSTRQSTDVVAIDDPDISAALRYIRQNACHGINVADITSHVAISRSTLERQLRKYLGRSPQQEIRHVQVKRVSELLTTTELSADRIANLCGFEHPEYMQVVFKRIVGMTPGQFRKRSADGGGRSL